LDVLATLNTDDPSVSDSTLTDEYYLGVQKLNLDYADLKKMTLNAADAAFLPPDQRRQLRDSFESQLPENKFA
jgi:adenosine deaminase